MSWWKRVWNCCSSRQDKTPSNNQTTARESYTSEDVPLRGRRTRLSRTVWTQKTGVAPLPSVGFLVAACLQTGNRAQHELLQLTNIQTPLTIKEPLSPEKHLRSSGAWRDGRFPLPFRLEACLDQFKPQKTPPAPSTTPLIVTSCSSSQLTGWASRTTGWSETLFLPQPFTESPAPPLPGVFVGILRNSLWTTCVSSGWTHL